MEILSHSLKYAILYITVNIDVSCLLLYFFSFAVVVTSFHQRKKKYLTTIFSTRQMKWRDKRSKVKCDIREKEAKKK